MTRTFKNPESSMASAHQKQWPRFIPKLVRITYLLKAKTMDEYWMQFTLFKKQPELYVLKMKHIMCTFSECVVLLLFSGCRFQIMMCGFIFLDP